jgi:hypothetical protein
MRKNLFKVIHNDEPITDAEKESLIELLSKGRRSKTREKIEKVVTHRLDWRYFPSHMILARVYFNDEGKACYCAGQDYTSELTYIVNQYFK